MKIDFKKYGIIWAILFVLFNALCFVTPSEINGESKYTNGFWIGYAFITAAFIGQLFCTYLAFKPGKVKELIYSSSFITISVAGLAIMLLVGGITMAIPQIPEWLGILVCLFVLAFTAIKVVKASSAVDAVEQIEQNVKTKTLFIRSLTADAQAVIAKADAEEIKAEANKVFEAIRYSDPMSDDVLSGIETQIENAFRSFKAAVAANDVEMAKSASKTVIELVEERNVKCKLIK